MAGPLLVGQQGTFLSLQIAIVQQGHCWVVLGLRVSTPCFWVLGGLWAAESQV